VSVHTKDDIADQVGTALDALEECDAARPASVFLANREAIIVLRRLHEELMIGRVEREKSRRKKARDASRRLQGETPLWGDA